MPFRMVFGPLWACFSADCHEIVYAHSYDRGTSIYVGLKVDLANRQVFATDTLRNMERRGVEKILT